MSTPLQQQQQFGTTPYTPHEHSALQAELHQKLGPEYVAHRAGGAGKSSTLQFCCFCFSCPRWEGGGRERRGNERDGEGWRGMERDGEGRRGEEEIN